MQYITVHTSSFASLAVPLALSYRNVLCYVGGMSVCYSDFFITILESFSSYKKKLLMHTLTLGV